MKWLNCEKIRMLLVVFLAAIALSGGSAKADFTFGEPTNLGPMVNCTAYNFAPCISENGLKIYYSCSSDIDVQTGDILVGTREAVDEPWSEPMNLVPNVNSPRNEMEPAISANELELYFVRGNEYPNILVAKRSSKEEPWDSPIALLELGYGREPDISPDGL